MMKSWLEVRSLVAFVLVLVALLPGSVAAQGTARSMDIDGSAISSAMGGASAAVFWSAEPNYWANPALLGYYHGVRYQYARSQLVPGLATDVILTSHRVTLAAYGVGVELGGTRLDYGTSVEVDEYGNPIGEFDSHEQVDAIAAGLSLSGLAEAIAPGSRAAGWGRNFDLALGFARKDVEMVFAPPWLVGKASASGAPCDVGMLVRGGLDLVPVRRGAVPVRLDVGFGAAVLNFNDVEFTFLNEDLSSPPSRMRRVGGTARLAVGLPVGWSGTAGSGFGAAFLRGLDPLVSIGAACDAEHVQAGSASAGAFDVSHVGGELALLNFLSARVGSVTDRTGDIEGMTWGLGVGLPIAGVAGARYDYAEYPQSTSLPNVTRHTASVFVDPIALWRLLR
jgi:hypothetical protein